MRQPVAPNRGSAHDPSHSLSDVSLARRPPRRPLAHQSGRQTVAVRFRRAGRPTSPLPSPCAFWKRLWLKKKPLRSSSAADLATWLRRPSLWLILHPDLQVSLLPVPGANAHLCATRPAPVVQAAEGSHGGAARQTEADLATIDPRGPHQAEGMTRSGLTVRTKPWRLPKVSPTPPCRKPQTPSEPLKPQMREAMGSSDRLPPAALTVL